MLSIAHGAVALAIIGTVANAASLPRATERCTTINSGYLHVVVGRGHSTANFQPAMRAIKLSRGN